MLSTSVPDDFLAISIQAVLWSATRYVKGRTKHSPNFSPKCIIFSRTGWKEQENYYILLKGNKKTGFIRVKRVIVLSCYNERVICIVFYAKDINNLSSYYQYKKPVSWKIWETKKSPTKFRIPKYLVKKKTNLVELRVFQCLYSQ